MTQVRGIKKLKKAPASANKVKLFTDNGWTLYWKGRARARRPGAVKPARPRANKWASLIVFLHDPVKRKRSFHVAWNGHRFNDTPEAELLRDREWAIYRDLKQLLPDFNERLIKPSRRQDEDVDRW